MDLIEWFCSSEGAKDVLLGVGVSCSGDSSVAIQTALEGYALTRNEPVSVALSRLLLLAAVRRESVEPNTNGLYGKYVVFRADGRDVHCAGDRRDVDYFVLDAVHDRFAKAALSRYASACRSECPELAADVEKLAGGRSSIDQAIDVLMGSSPVSLGFAQSVVSSQLLGLDKLIQSARDSGFDAYSDRLDGDATVLSALSTLISEAAFSLEISAGGSVEADKTGPLPDTAAEPVAHTPPEWCVDCRGYLKCRRRGRGSVGGPLCVEMGLGPDDKVAD